jgi:uncharacterized protein DUF2637
MKRAPAAYLALGAGLATVALTGSAFWLSYAHLHAVADGHGLIGVRAWAWPSTVDLFIVVGELLMLRASLLGRTDPWAVALTAIGSLGSVALNVAGVGAGQGALAYVVAAVPPSAALVAFGALLHQIRPVLAAVPGAPGAPAVPEPGVPAPARVRTASRVRTRSSRTRAVPGAGATSAPGTPDPLTARVRTEYTDANGYPSVRELKARYSIGQARAQRIRDALATV